MHTWTVCSLYTRALQGALGKHILILIPFYSIPFYSMLAHGREKKSFFFLPVLSLLSAVHETYVSEEYH